MQSEFANLLSALSEDNFNVVVKEFNKEYYSTNDVRIVNGPYDGGIDLEIYKDGNDVKRNIQVAVQKTKLEQKLRVDLGKAKENTKKYSYHSLLTEPKGGIEMIIQVFVISKRQRLCKLFVLHLKPNYYVMKYFLLSALFLAFGNVVYSQSKLIVPEKNKTAFAKFAEVRDNKILVGKGYTLKKKSGNKVAMLNNNGGVSGYINCSCNIKKENASCAIVVEGNDVSCFGECQCTLKVTIRGSKSNAVARQSFKMVAQ